MAKSTPADSGPDLPGPARGKRFPPALLALVIPLCAIGPWLIPWPWQDDVAVTTSDPSAYIRQARAGQNSVRPNGAPDSLPSDEDVQALAKQLANAGGRGYDTPVSAAAAAHVKTKPGPYQKLGRVRIPRTGLDVTYGEGVHPKALDRGPGHWPGTPLPGDRGTAVLSGHRNTHTRPFKYLNLLRPGDKIITSVGAEKPVTFRVIDTTIVPEATYSAFVLKPAKDPAAHNLTLFACHPEGNPTFRIVIRGTSDAPTSRGTG